MNQQILELATKIAADTALLNGVGVDLISAGEASGIDHKDLDPSIALSIDGNQIILWEFSEPSDSYDWPEEVVDLLDQFQDVIVRDLWVAWPQCPMHSHVLVPELEAREPKWRCPDDALLTISLGGLNSQP
jgi:hypothetical protein